MPPNVDALVDSITQLLLHNSQMRLCVSERPAARNASHDVAASFTCMPAAAQDGKAAVLLVCAPPAMPPLSEPLVDSTIPSATSH